MVGVVLLSPSYAVIVILPLTLFIFRCYGFVKDKRPGIVHGTLQDGAARLSQTARMMCMDAALVVAARAPAPASSCGR